MNTTACLLFSSPDQPGIIARISHFFHERNLNIISLEQHSDEGHFFVRVEWEDTKNWKEENNFCQDFSSLSKKFKGRFRVHFFSKKQTLGLFVSQEAHVLLEILSKWELLEFPNLHIPFLISNFKESQPFADRHNIPFFYIPTQKNSQEHEIEQLKVIQKFQPDFIGLARYMKILSKHFIESAGCPIVNIHHSFLPSFVGAKPYEMAHQKGVKLIGATSHFVIPELDQGPIIEQDVTRIRSGYSLEKLKQMGGDTEKKVFSHALKKALEHKIILFQDRTIIFE